MELLCEEVTATDTASLSDQEREAPARQQQILHFLDVKEIHGYNPGGCHRVNAYFPKSSSIDDDREGSGAVVEDDRGPWWANDPELIEIRRRTVEEFDRELDQREPGPIPWSPTSSAARTCAIGPMPATISNVPAPDMSTRCGPRRRPLVGEIGRVLNVPKAAAAPPVPSTIARRLGRNAPW
jgi:hypothetical protein